MGLKFPPSYRIFLLKFGAVDDIAGLPDPLASEDDRLFFDVVRLSKLVWGTGENFELMRHLIFLEGNGGDYRFYLDSSRPDQEGEYPVVIVGPGSLDKIYAKNFFEYIKPRFGVE